MPIRKNNISKTNTIGQLKGRGKKPGSPKKPAGTLVEIRHLAQSHSKTALNRIVDLTGSNTPSVALAACREILDRAYGKPVQATEITGKNGEAVAIDVTAITERLNAKLGPASDEQSP